MSKGTSSSYPPFGAERHRTGVGLGSLCYLRRAVEDSSDFFCNAAEGCGITGERQRQRAASRSIIAVQEEYFIRVAIVALLTYFGTIGLYICYTNKDFWHVPGHYTERLIISAISPGYMYALDHVQFVFTKGSMFLAAPPFRFSTTISQWSTSSIRPIFGAQLANASQPCQHCI